jgi:hypothetical protein
MRVFVLRDGGGGLAHHARCAAMRAYDDTLPAARFVRVTRGTRFEAPVAFKETPTARIRAGGGAMRANDGYLIWLRAGQGARVGALVCRQ